MINAGAQSVPEPIQLVNGWKLSPVGKSFPLGDLPLNLAVSKNSKYMAVTNNGQGIQSIQLIDLKTEKITDSVTIGKSWYGLKFSADERYLYASGGHDNWIVQYEIKNNKLVLADRIVLGKPWPTKIGPAGIEIDEQHQKMYVVTRENSSLYIIDLKTKQIEKQLGLDAEGYDCKINNSTKELYVSCWGCDKVLILDMEKNVWKAPISVGDNPNEMILSPDEKLLYVCNSNDNSVSIIDLKSKHVIETLDAALFPNSPSGSTTNSVALDFKNKRLYIANANNNCIAVFDVTNPGKSMSKGFIPVGWYPTSVRLINGKLWVANGKGFTPKANPFGPSPLRKREEVIHHGGITKQGSEVQYIGSLFTGTMSVIPVPSQTLLDQYSKAVYRNTPYSISKTAIADAKAPGYPIPVKLGQASPIKYVFYIIKENRTYDQVLADVKGGNGDTSLLLFGKNITPNQHAIAESFVLLDNFYVVCFTNVFTYRCIQY